MGLLSQKQCVLFLFLLFSGLSNFAQPNTSIDLDKDKPKQYENRKLRSEKTGDTKFSAGKRFYQNLVTHYNYFFNANNKLNDIVISAKSGYQDDYSQLLSFYNYTLDATSQQKQQLDSVIYKCNAGILLHDLRSDWIDDMYLLLGKAYLLKKDFDSAQQVFQYINYIYAPKDDGYDIPIGSNDSKTNGVFSVSTEEKTNLFKKISSKPPSRNESFIWQARNYLEQNKISEAVGLLAILKADPKFPARLKTDLNEMIAYAYYKQNNFDSSAVYLQRSLSNAEGKAEIARWEFLTAQLYQQSGMINESEKMYSQSIKHTIDPYLDVYARLNLVQLSSSKNKSTAIQDNLSELYKLAKRDKYENYRNIIYYATAVLQQQQNNTDNAKSDLKKSLRFGTDNPQQKQKSFLLLADLNYDSKNYKEAFNYYDSIQLSLLKNEDRLKVEKRKPALKIVSENLVNIHLQDSLLTLANMPDAERSAAVKKVYKQIRKEQGSKDIEDNDFGSNTNSTATNLLFGSSTTNTSNFYFLNAAVKAQGFKEFKTFWGNRPNVDNWQRQTAVTRFTTTQNNPFNVADVDMPQTGTATKDSKDVTVENLLLNVPLTDKKMQAANESIAKSYFNNGLTFQNMLETYQPAANAYESLLNKYPVNKDLNEQSLFNLAFCYFKLGETTKFDSVKNILNTKYADTKYADQLNNTAIKEKDDATKTYEHVYDLFIEGRFDDAKLAKQAADNKFGTTFWTPQLLYIESVYYIKQKQDSVAINRLQSIVSKFPKEILAEKSKTMIDVLKRRNEIESYLTNLQIDSAKDDVFKRVDLDTVVAVKAPTVIVKKDTALVNKSALITKEIRTDAKPIVIADAGFSITPTDPHYVVLVLNRVDEVFVNESKNAFSRFNRERYYNQKIDLNGFKLSNEFNLLLMGPFNSAGEAVNYIDNVKASVSTRIIPWLTADKYYFNIISNVNLDKVKTAKDITPYSKFLKQTFPDKF